MRARRARPRPGDDHSPGVWWLSPPGAVALVVPITLGLAVLFSPADFLTYFRCPKSLTTETALLFAAGALVLTLGAMATQLQRPTARRAGRWPWFDERQLTTLERCATVLFRVTMVGYASFVVTALRNGVSPGDVLASFLAQDVSSGDLENTIGTVPGVTTLTQVGVAYGVVAALLLCHRLDRRNLVRLAVLGLVTTVRAFVLTERLALIEIAVPMITVLALRVAHRTSPRRRLLVRLAPLPLIVLLVAGFAASEYSRSYTFFKARTDDGLLMFSLKRLSGYYATSYNNGQVLLRYDNYPGRLPYTSIEAVWTAPGIENIGLYDRLVGKDSDEAYTRLLHTYASEEFNNPGGLPAPFIDFGRGGGLVVLLGFGLATGYGYRSFVQGRLGGVLLYPVVVTGLFELPRFLYWTLGRTVPTVLALLLVYLAVDRSTRYAPRVTA